MLTNFFATPMFNMFSDMINDKNVLYMKQVDNLHSVTLLIGYLFLGDMWLDVASRIDSTKTCVQTRRGCIMPYKTPQSHTTNFIMPHLL